MRRIPPELLDRMAVRLAPEDRDEMAIPSYRHSNPALRFIAWRRVQALAALLASRCRELGAPRELSVMDYGCGTGVLLAECRRGAERVYGVDPVLSAAQLLVQEWALDDVDLLLPEQVEDRVEAGTLDLILAGEVLEHVEPLAPTLSMFRRLLKPNGVLLASLPTENTLYRLGRRIAGFEGHYHHGTAASVHREILAAGYRLREKRSLPGPGPLSIFWLLDYRLG